MGSIPVGTTTNHRPAGFQRGIFYLIKNNHFDRFIRSLIARTRTIFRVWFVHIRKQIVRHTYYFYKSNNKFFTANKNTIFDRKNSTFQQASLLEGFPRRRDKSAARNRPKQAGSAPGSESKPEGAQMRRFRRSAARAPDSVSPARRNPDEDPGRE